MLLQKEKEKEEKSVEEARASLDSIMLELKQKILVTKKFQ